MALILVCGNRDWMCEETIFAWLSRLPKDTTILHGAQTTRDAQGRPIGGADYLAGLCARRLGFAVDERPADWKKHGKAAGPLRNEEMATLMPKRGLAFGRIMKGLTPATGHTGTGDMATRLLSRGIAVTVIPTPGCYP